LFEHKKNVPIFGKLTQIENEHHPNNSEALKVLESHALRVITNVKRGPKLKKITETKQTQVMNLESFRNALKPSLEMGSEQKKAETVNLKGSPESQ